MNKFNGFVKFILEVDAPEAAPAPGRSETPLNGRNVIDGIVKHLESIGEERSAKSIRTKILDSRDVNVQRALDDSIQSDEQWNNLARTLGMLYDTSKSAPSDNKHLPTLGKDPGRWNQAAIESSFYDLLYHWKKGSLLKKLEMILQAPLKIAKGVGKFIMPTSKGSTGVFA